MTDAVAPDGVGAAPSRAMFSKELRFLLDGLGFDPARVPLRAPPELDWVDLVRLLQLHRLAPRLGAWLQDLPGVPPPVAGEIGDIRRNAATAALGLAAELVRFSAKLDGAGIPFISVKGPLLAQRLYGSPAGREFGDLDILVPEDRAWEAMRMLEAEGFEPLAIVPPGYEPKFLRVACENRHMHPDGRVIEIHWSLLHPDWGPPGLTASAWQGKQQADLAGRAIAVPPWDLHAALLVLHGHKHAWACLQWLVDVAEAVRQDSGLPARLERAWPQWAAVFDSTWRTCDAVFGTTLHDPGRVNDTGARLHATIMEWLARETDEEPGRVDRFRFLGASLPDAKARVRWAQAHLRPQPADWVWVGLPPGMSFLYYALRPVRLVLKRQGHGGHEH